MFYDNRWNGKITPLMIKYLGVSLRELILTEPINVPMIENISKYCSNITTLEIAINSDTDLLVFPYFNDLKIRVLNIVHYQSNLHMIRISSINLDEKFINLANNLPINVKEVSIRIKTYGPILFEKFLENCHGHLEIINLKYFIKLKLLKLILNYINRSNDSLKILGVFESRSGKTIKKKELKLLNQIKAKGIEIVDFNSIYETCDERFNNF
jgi:hypothetical protein